MCVLFGRLQPLENGFQWCFSSFSGILSPRWEQAKPSVESVWPSSPASFIKDACSCQLICVSRSPDDIKSLAVGLIKLFWAAGFECGRRRQEGFKTDVVLYTEEAKQIKSYTTFVCTVQSASQIKMVEYKKHREINKNSRIIRIHRIKPEKITNEDLLNVTVKRKVFNLHLKVFSTVSSLRCTSS